MTVRHTIGILAAAGASLWLASAPCALAADAHAPAAHPAAAPMKLKRNAEMPVLPPRLEMSAKPMHGAKDALWAYSGNRGPEHWAELSRAYRTCADGTHQSPVNIDTAGVARMPSLAVHYKVSLVHLDVDGQLVRATYGEGSYITIGKERFDLRHFDLHTPSEHRIAGRDFPMEIQFVHENAQGRKAIVSVLSVAGEDNLAARELLERLPEAPHGRMGDPRILMNARDLLPENTRYFRYTGSLTKPPCTEEVDWFVLQTPVPYAVDQISRLYRVVGGNARPVQARNGRFLLQSTGG